MHRILGEDLLRGAVFLLVRSVEAVAALAIVREEIRRGEAEARP